MTPLAGSQKPCPILQHSSIPSHPVLLPAQSHAAPPSSPVLTGGSRIWGEQRQAIDGHQGREAEEGCGHKVGRQQGGTWQMPGAMQTSLHQACEHRPLVCGPWCRRCSAPCAWWSSRRARGGARRRPAPSTLVRRPAGKWSTSRWVDLRHGAWHAHLCQGWLGWASRRAAR